MPISSASGSGISMPICSMMYMPLCEHANAEQQKCWWCLLTHGRMHPMSPSSVSIIGGAATWPWTLVDQNGSGWFISNASIYMFSHPADSLAIWRPCLRRRHSRFLTHSRFLRLKPMSLLVVLARCQSPLCDWPTCRPCDWSPNATDQEHVVSESYGLSRVLFYFC